jgi:hypothetical protein
MAVSGLSACGSDVRDPQMFDGRKDEELQIATILLRCAFLEMHRDVLVIEPISELTNSQGSTPLSPFELRIDIIAEFDESFQSYTAGLIGSDRAETS